MELKLSRSLNGVPKTLEEMKSMKFESKILTEIIQNINNRRKLATDDKN